MKMKELVNKLNKAAKAYYSEGKSIMSDKQYDALYDELVQMEKDTGVILANSPTQRVGYVAVSSLDKVQLKYPALSLNKTKDTEDIKKWMEGRESVLSWKLDGLTIVASYHQGVLESLVTRGNGSIGEDVTHNAPYVSGIPKTIPYKGDLVVRGEAVISYQDFKLINETEIAPGEEPYKNPRNLAASSIRSMDTERTAKRHLQFMAFTVADPYEKDTPDIPGNLMEVFDWLEKIGFSVVEHMAVTAETVEDGVKAFSDKVPDFPFPVDGLVFAYDKFDRTLGSTGKFPRHSMAFKWEDETKETTLREIEWSASATGLLNPVAIFDPVELEGTTVKRASVHNVSTIKELDLHIGDTVTIYKANMIIPQIDENLGGGGSDPVKIPSKCPVCSSETVIKEGKKENVSSLYCTNPDCPAKHVGRFTRLVDRMALNVTGVSKATLQEFLNHGFLKEPSDLFHLSKHKDEIVQMEGFGEKSYMNMINAIENARNSTFQRFFYSLGIPGAGKNVAKILDKYFEENLDQGESKVDQLFNMVFSGGPCFLELEGIGETNENAIITWFTDHRSDVTHLLQELTISDEHVEKKAAQKTDLEGLTFVITGSLEHFKNRNALKEEIESRGGRVSGSLSKRTSYLINNDITSSSSKNTNAKKMGIKIISEDDFLSM